MSLRLKSRRVPIWLNSLSLSEYAKISVILQGDDPEFPVAVPAALLVASSSLVRNILSSGHLHPVYSVPVISIPSVSYYALRIVGVMLVTGEAVIEVKRMREILDVFKLLNIDAGLVCVPEYIRSILGERSDAKSDFDQQEEKQEEFKIIVKLEREYNLEDQTNINKVKGGGIDDAASLSALEVKKVRRDYDNLFISENHVEKVNNMDRVSSTSSCDICHQNFKDLYRHVQIIHKKKGQGEHVFCSDCNKNVLIKNFSRHVKETHEGLRTSCPHCDKKLVPSNLGAHLRHVHKKKAKVNKGQLLLDEAAQKGSSYHVKQ